MFEEYEFQYYPLANEVITEPVSEFDEDFVLTQISKLKA